MRMKIVSYIIRFLLSALFLWAGYEKLFIPYNAEVFRAGCPDCAIDFFTFYELLERNGYLYFVGFLQLLCGVLLVFKRSYVLAAIMLVPLILCLLMTHVFFSKNTSYIVFDSSIFLLNAILIGYNFKNIRQSILKPQQGWI